MYQIQTLNKISPIGLGRFDRAKYTWGDEMEAPDAVLVRSASMHDMDFSCLTDGDCPCGCRCQQYSAG